MKLREASKAIVGAVIAGLGAAGTAAADGAVSVQEGIGIALAFFVALGVVYASPANEPSPPEPPAPAPAPPAPAT